jgi:hypothetical protein
MTLNKYLVLAVLLAPGVAAAQRGGYYGGGGGQPTAMPGGFHERTNLLSYGGSIGLGYLHDDGSLITSCMNCNFSPVTVELDGHVGIMLSPRFGLMLESQFNAQTVHSDRFNGDTILSQGTGVVAGQFWLTPQFWAKAGLGVAQLQRDSTYVTEDFGTGGALLLAAGFEVLSAQFFALEVQGRFIEGAYNGGHDHVTSGTIGVGVNWY